ncbi:hypothetical protein BLA39750_03132 [Burkholderia lata]|uniref:Uncharacterized protein n=1 Tax=Burkholderia lata (strain ATCC 17760 / DSM 23089 / LMG 22485 / NCIMB 9086 / R18194 / 383) TaxID=482957 RepID=A0A6P2XJV6_BURL3|nr:hypothetical protein BLA39750_03132 [Burkholderia lata]
MCDRVPSSAASVFNNAGIVLATFISEPWAPIAAQSASPRIGTKVVRTWRIEIRLGPRHHQSMRFSTSFFDTK